MIHHPDDIEPLDGYDETQRAEIEEAEGEHPNDGLLVTDLANEQLDVDGFLQPTAADEQLTEIDDGSMDEADIDGTDTHPDAETPNKPGFDRQNPMSSPAIDNQSSVTPDDYPADSDGKPDYK